VGTRPHASRSNNCRAVILAANKQTADFVCTTFNGVLPPSNIYAIHLNRGRTQVFASSNESFGVRWEAERHTAFLRFASIAYHLAHWRITPGRKKRRRRFALPAQSKKCDKKMSPNRFRRQLANDVPQNPANASKEIIVLKSAR